MTHQKLVIGFIGLGHMGGPMAKNLIKKGFEVIGVDLNKDNLEEHKKHGGAIASSNMELAQKCDVIITMLPAGKHVHGVCAGENGLFKHAKKNTLFIDCSSIDVATAQLLAKLAQEHHHVMVDAPVSGGTVGADAGTLTFIVGGEKEGFERAKSILEHMGKKIVHTGLNGTGVACKICNNMLLGISMVGVCEAFNLGKKLGIDPKVLFDICSTSTGQCWSLNTNCPEPNILPNAPSSHNYEPGFGVALILKDLKLSQEAAHKIGAATPLGAMATEIYELVKQHGHEGKDFSIVLPWLHDKK